MFRTLARLALVASVVLGTALVPPARSTVLARGEDVCEPNDRFQDACYLGPGADALGFIQNPADVDTYRIEVLDFKVQATIALADRPLPYRISVQDWNGDTMAESMDGTLEMVINVPGSYYVTVDSPTGAFHPDLPYRIARRLLYPGASIPQILESSSFKLAEGFVEDDDAVYSDDGGRFLIQMKHGGTPETPSRAEVTFTSDCCPEFTDFTMTVDTAVIRGSNAGYMVSFRYVDEDNRYRLIVDTKDGQVRLGKIIDGQFIGPDWRKVTGINTQPGAVNRTTIRAVGNHIQVWVNGVRMYNVTDDDLQSGIFGFGTLGWAEPPTISFDNILVTTPTEGVLQ